ncbi:hypothetical protein CTEN210_03402 [Chaetoceros tenuissimus]|uniref:BTB domain-containing protein n=1 Tax=Chaetoceros tenuissimus TaxID=426638 RepID=A0AAD3CJ99_9STRA|nr:hypothetical protein CTEN210_03402 [Chaetoceros tenuissimus]
MSTISKSTTVQLDVGGTLYKVSLSLIANFPDSMLASIVSNKWKEKYQEEIFIERNGHRFQYVLDYMRDGEATLPKGECAESLYKELEYFGIEFDSAKITSTDCLNIPESIDNYLAWIRKFDSLKHAQARSHVETLFTIDVISRALKHFPSATYSKYINIILQYGIGHSESTESKTIYEFLLKNKSKEVIDEIVTRVNENILDLNLRIRRTGQYDEHAFLLERAS